MPLYSFIHFLMRILTLFTTFILLFCSSSCDVVNQATQVLAQQNAVVSQTDMVNGLKQALEIGTGKSSDHLSATDGFFGNAAIKLLFPPEAQKAEKALRAIGLNNLCDNLILSLNRAAEDAAKEARPIFIAAIKQMTIQDASNILLGKQDAATQYFKRTTSNALTEKFKPVIEKSLGKVGATKYYGYVVTRYNQIPLVSKINPDLNDYVTQKALEGLFLEIAKEELKIRTNISARTSPLLQKVFGYADKNK